MTAFALFVLIAVLVLAVRRLCGLGERILDALTERNDP